MDDFDDDAPRLIPIYPVGGLLGSHEKFKDCPHPVPFPQGNFLYCEICGCSGQDFNTAVAQHTKPGDGNLFPLPEPVIGYGNDRKRRLREILESARLESRANFSSMVREARLILSGTTKLEFPPEAIDELRGIFWEILRDKNSKTRLRIHCAEALFMGDKRYQQCGNYQTPTAKK